MSRMSDLLEIEKAKGRSDFYWFSKYMYGNSDMVEHVHRGICDKIVKWNYEKTGAYELLILQPRGFFKSSIGEAYVTWELEKNRNMRVLITGETVENGIRRLSAIKSCIEKPEFVEVYGDLKNDPKTKKPIKWAEDEITLVGRSGRGVLQREGSVTVSAPGSTKTGMHYDLIVADDLVGPSNVTTSNLIEKTKDYYKQLLSLIEPGGKIIFIGTRWSYDDLYGWMLGENEEK